MNASGGLDIADPIYLLKHLFGNGPAPVAFACCDTVDSRLSLLEAAAAGLEFGRNVAGTFVGTEEFNGVPVAGFSATVHPLGGMCTTSTGDFSPQDDYASSDLGQWRQTEERQITATLVKFRYNAQGVLTGLVKAVARIDFTDGFDAFSGTLRASVFPPPVPGDLTFADCEAEGEPWITFTIAGRRLEVCD